MTRLSDTVLITGPKRLLIPILILPLHTLLLVCITRKIVSQKQEVDTLLQPSQAQGISVSSCSAYVLNYLLRPFHSHKAS